ncbi:hypothetical protein WJX72_006317 [[Myrmecia] bisecta]|uniref:Rhodanese domain-containing protein n=1 Tax=[Myrmecia] bisecta TaxID=41462 RepID=A0AAW1Q445_9CHLO
MASASAQITAPSLARTPCSSRAVRPRSTAVRAVAHAEESNVLRRAAQLGASLPLILTAPAAWAEDLGVTLPTPEATSQAISDATGALPSDVQQLLTDSPWLIPGAIGVVAVPLLLAGVLGGGVGSKAKATSAVNAFEALKEEPRTVFVDIRNKQDVKEFGSPDLRAARKSIVSVPYTQVVSGEAQVVEDFAQKLGKVRSIKEDSIVILFDSYCQDSPKAAKAIADLVETVYYVTGGGEGPSGWKASELPWKAPGFQLDLGGLGTSVDNFAEEFKAAPSVTKLGIAAGAIGAASLVIFNEVEVLLEVLGVLVAGQFFAKNVLFAKDRKSTTEKIKVLVDEKIKPQEAATDLKKLANTLLETEQTAEKAAGSTARAKGRQVQDLVAQKTKEAEQFAKQWPPSKKLASAAEQVRQEAKPVAKDLSSKAQDVKKETSAAAKDLSAKAKDTAKDVQKDSRAAAKDLSSKTKETTKEAEAAAKDVKKEVQGGAQQAKQELNGAAKETKKELNGAAKDTKQELNGAVDWQADPAKKEAREWISSWRKERSNS